MMLKGLTAQYLLRQTYRVKEGDTILVHAAAGGVGLSSASGAGRSARTSSAPSARPKKPSSPERPARSHTILYREEDFAKRVEEITKGAKCARGL